MLTKTIKKTTVLFLIMFVGITLLNCASISPPLSAELNILPPSAELPPELAAFSGIWKGTLSNGLELMLVVEKIDANKAEVIISFGQTYEYKGFYQYHEADFILGPALQVALTDGQTIIFKINKELNKLSTTYNDRAIWSEGELFRLTK